MDGVELSVRGGGESRAPMRLTFLLLSAALAGCAGTYVISSGEPTAHVRFTTNVPGSTVFRQVPEPLCQPAQGNNIASFTSFTDKSRSEVKMLPTAAREGEATLERAVGAGKPLYVLASTYLYEGYGDLSCSVGMKWRPEPGREYEMSFELRDRRRCGLRVSELVATVNGVEHKKVETVFIPARFTKDFCGY